MAKARELSDFHVSLFTMVGLTNWMKRIRTKRRGFTLIELMCCLTIIAILVGMMLGPISKALGKAKRFEWEQRVIIMNEELLDGLSRYYEGKASYPALDVENLRRLNIIQGRMHEYLKDKRVQYFPFDSKTPLATVILQASVSKKQTSRLTKADLRLND